MEKTIVFDGEKTMFVILFFSLFFVVAGKWVGVQRGQKVEALRDGCPLGQRSWNGVQRGGRGTAIPPLQAGK
jgi:hypothetical protein